MNVSIKFKSIASLRPSIIITFLFSLITIIISLKGVVALDKHKEIIADLPTAKDFDEYLTNLERLVDFFIRHKVYVDLNVEFGLFLINVNLKEILNEKRQSLPAKSRFRLEQLLLKNEVLVDYFQYMVQKTSDVVEYEQDRRISRLFYNESSWPMNVHTFNVDLLKQTKIYTPAQLEKIYGKWENYESNVYDYNKYKPTPDESDGCIAVLAGNPPSFNLKTPGNCQTPPQCKQGVKSGSEFGYGLSHRILFMIIAHFARGCTVFSMKEDKYKVDKYCMRSFNEAQYIASNNFQLADLMMEQMALCGLFGHSQFYRNSWLRKLLETQTKEGCFSELELNGTTYDAKMQEGANDEWTIATNEHRMMGGRCNGHLTAVGAAALASALRYIIESYY